MPDYWLYFDWLQISIYWDGDKSLPCISGRFVGLLSGYRTQVNNQERCLLALSGARSYLLQTQLLFFELSRKEESMSRAQPLRAYLKSTNFKVAVLIVVVVALVVAMLIGGLYISLVSH